jgi:hypothetical protein
MAPEHGLVGEDVRVFEDRAGLGEPLAEAGRGAGGGAAREGGEREYGEDRTGPAHRHKVGNRLPVRKLA